MKRRIMTLGEFRKQTAELKDSVWLILPTGPLTNIASRTGNFAVDPSIILLSLDDVDPARESRVSEVPLPE